MATVDFQFEWNGTNWVEPGNVNVVVGDTVNFKIFNNTGSGIFAPFIRNIDNTLFTGLSSTQVGPGSTSSVLGGQTHTESYVCASSATDSGIDCNSVSTGASSTNNSIIIAEDTNPNNWSFTDQVDRELNTQYESNEITISEISTSVNVVFGTDTLTGTEYRKKPSGGSYGSWTTKATFSVSDGDSFQIRGSTGNSNSTAYSCTVTVGSGSNAEDTWTLTTEAGNPYDHQFTYSLDPFDNPSFDGSTSSGAPDIIGPGDVVRFRYNEVDQQDNVEITNFNTAHWTNTSNIILDINNPVADKTVKNPPTYGSFSLNWNHSAFTDYTHYLETFLADTEPEQFTFPADVTGATLNTTYYSNTGTTTNNNDLDLDQQVTGINTAANISISSSGNGTAVYQLWNGSAWSVDQTSGTVGNNTYFRVVITTSASIPGDATAATLTIGSPSKQDTWTVTSLDDKPDQFTFTDVNNIGTSTEVTSAPITLQGFTSPATASVTTLNSGQMSINGGAYTTTDTAVSAGDIVSLKQTTGASYNTGYDVSLSVQGDTSGLITSDTFTATTVLNPGDGEVIDNNFVAPYSLRDIMRFFGGDDGAGLYEIRPDNLRAYFKGTVAGTDHVPTVTANAAIGTNAEDLKLTQFNNTETRLLWVTYPPTRQDIRFHSQTTGDQTLQVSWAANGQYEIGFSPGMWSLCDFMYSFTVDEITDPNNTGAAAGDVTANVSTGQWLDKTAEITLSVTIGEFEDVTYSGTLQIMARNEYDTSKTISATASWTMAHIDNVN